MRNEHTTDCDLVVYRDDVHTCDCQPLEVQCQQCEEWHPAEYSHEGRFGEGPIFAVVCGEFTDYYTDELVRPAAPTANLGLAEAMARVTGSVAATVTVERRELDGSLTTVSTDTYTRPQA